MCVLGVTQNFITQEGHYFEDNTEPDIEGAMKIMNNICFAWRKGYEPAEMQVNSSLRDSTRVSSF
jgi:hypothetical protein